MPEQPNSPPSFLETLAAIDESFPPAVMQVRDDSIRIYRLEEKSRYLGEYIAYLERRLAQLEP